MAVMTARLQEQEAKFERKLAKVTQKNDEYQRELEVANENTQRVAQSLRGEQQDAERRLRESLTNKHQEIVAAQVSSAEAAAAAQAERERNARLKEKARRREAERQQQAPMPAINIHPVAYVVDSNNQRQQQEPEITAAPIQQQYAVSSPEPPVVRVTNHASEYHPIPEKPHIVTKYESAAAAIFNERREVQAEMDDVLRENDIPVDAVGLETSVYKAKVRALHAQADVSRANFLVTTRFGRKLPMNWKGL